MISLIWIGLSLGLSIFGIRGLLDGIATIGLGTRIGGATNPDYSIVLTGNRAFVFNIICVVTGLITGIVWIALFPRAAQSTLENTGGDVIKYSLLTAFASGTLCALWEKLAAPKTLPDARDD